MTESTKKSGARTGFSRRKFLQGSSAVAAVTALQVQNVTAQEEKDTSKVVSGTTTIALEVNGEKQQLKVEPRTTLLDALRYQLNLTGAKPVSSDGSSGASTVLLDDKPVSAETILAITCEGKKVRTVESLGGENPDVVPKAFVANDAQQCGFCTPGFVVAVRAFLDKHPNATEEQIRNGLNGNICRCGTYADIVRAVTSCVKGGQNG